MIEAKPESRRWGIAALWLGIALAVLATLGTLSGLLADRLWICEIACHFQVQYAVGLLVLAGGFGLARRWWIAGALFAAMLLASVVHWLPYYWSDRPLATGPRSLRLLSANLDCFNPALDGFYALVDRERPDLILAFELTHEWAALLKMQERGYKYLLSVPSPGHSGFGIYSRFPLRTASVDPLGPQPNFVIDARVVIGRTELRVFGTHPLAPYTPAEMELRNGQFDALANLVGRAKARTIVAGDFNTTSWSPCFPKFMAATGLYDTRRGFGVCPTFPSWFWPARTPIDHCLVSGDIAVVDRRVGADIGSDHLPILVDLQLADPAR